MTFFLGVKNYDGNGGNILAQRNHVKVTLTISNGFITKRTVTMRNVQILAQ